MWFSSMSKPRTLTVPGGNGGAMAPAADGIVQLREVGGQREWALPASQTTFKLGSSSGCDILVDSPYVSALHAVLDRRGNKLRVHDVQSKNGIFFRDRREATFEMEACERFRVGNTTLCALGEEMYLAHRALRPLIGLGDLGLID